VTALAKLCLSVLVHPENRLERHLTRVRLAHRLTENGRKRAHGSNRPAVHRDRQGDERKVADDSAVIVGGHHAKGSGAGVVLVPVTKYRLERSPFCFFFPQALEPGQIIGLKYSIGEAALQSVTSSPQTDRRQATTPGPLFERTLEVIESAEVLLRRRTYV